MSFKINQKGKGAEVKILRHENPNYVNRFGIIKRISLSTQMAYLELVDEKIEIQVPMKDLLKS